MPIPLDNNCADDCNLTEEFENNEYVSASQSCEAIGTVVSEVLIPETDASLKEMQEDISTYFDGQDVDEMVRRELNYKTINDLCNALRREQIDGVARYILNKRLGKSMIIADETGVGKGRQAAAIIRYECLQNKNQTPKKLPIFISAKDSLFSDIKRDLDGIGSGDLLPFIVNDTKLIDPNDETNILIIAKEQKNYPKILNGAEMDRKYDFICATYSQFSSPFPKDKKPLIAFLKEYLDLDKDFSSDRTIYKHLQSFVKNLLSGNIKPSWESDFADILSKKNKFLFQNSKGNILILDESHLAAGTDSNTGLFFQILVGKMIENALFLSATYAKKPENMALFSLKSSMGKSNLHMEDVFLAIRRGGIALQEVITSMLVKEGDLIRREKKPIAISDYKVIQEDRVKQMQIADTVTSVLREMIDFQRTDIKRCIEKAKAILLLQGNIDLKVDKQNEDLGARSADPIFQRLFQIIYKMLFSIKVDATVKEAIQNLKKGKAVVIAFSQTFESNAKDLEGELEYSEDDLVEETEDEEKYGRGVLVDLDFMNTLLLAFKNIFSVIMTDDEGKEKTYHLKDDFDDILDSQTLERYEKIVKKIKSVKSGISISPIDVVTARLEKEGYKVAELTGRKQKFIFQNENYTFGQKVEHKKLNTTETVSQFNNNEIDVLLINSSAATGLSMHALPNKKISKEKVKPRVMVFMQSELNVNTEIQKRGRIDRTGQIHAPEFIYLSTALPSEQRMMMMLRNKLKSLDANSSGFQNKNADAINVVDFNNHYGDSIVLEYLKTETALCATLEMLKDIENFKEDNFANISGKLSSSFLRKMAVLPVALQEKALNEVQDKYTDLVDDLKANNLYNLELEKLDLQAKTLTRITLIKGLEDNSFSRPLYLEIIKGKRLDTKRSQFDLINLIKENSQKGVQILNMYLPRKISLNASPEQYHEKAKEVILDLIKKEKNEIAKELHEKAAEQYQQAYDAWYPSYLELYHHQKTRWDRKLRKDVLIIPEASYRIEHDYFSDNDFNIQLLTLYSVCHGIQNLNKTQEKKTDKYAIKSNHRKERYDIFNYLADLVESMPIKGILGEKSDDNDLLFLGFQIQNPESLSGFNFLLADPKTSVVFKFKLFNVASLPYNRYRYSRLDEEEKLALWNEWNHRVSKISDDFQDYLVLSGNMIKAAAAHKGRLVKITTDSGKVRNVFLLNIHFSDGKNKDKEKSKADKALYIPLNESELFGRQEGKTFAELSVLFFDRNQISNFRINGVDLRGVNRFGEILYLEQKMHKNDNSQKLIKITQMAKKFGRTIDTEEKADITTHSIWVSAKDLLADKDFELSIDIRDLKSLLKSHIKFLRDEKLPYEHLDFSDIIKREMVEDNYKEIESLDKDQRQQMQKSKGSFGKSKKATIHEVIAKLKIELGLK